MSFWLGVTGRPSFSKKDEVWVTKLCKVEAPHRPGFCDKNKDGVYKLDDALGKAVDILSKEYNKYPLPHRLNSTCSIKLVTDMEFEQINTGHLNANGVTMKYPLSCKILINTLDKVVLGHELLHFAEWKLGIKTTEGFIYSYESEVAKRL